MIVYTCGLVNAQEDVEDFALPDSVLLNASKSALYKVLCFDSGTI